MIEVKTIMSEQLLRKFNTAQTRSRIWLPFIVMAVLITAGVICLFVDGLGAVCGIPVICIGVAVPVAYVAVTRILVRKMVQKSAAVQNGTTQIVRFSDRIMVNESSKYTSAQDACYSYDEVSKAVEREEAFYLYIGARVYLLDAKGFSMGSRRDLHDVLLSKLGKKRFRYSGKLYAKK